MWLINIIISVGYIGDVLGRGKPKIIPAHYVDHISCIKLKYKWLWISLFSMYKVLLSVLTCVKRQKLANNAKQIQTRTLIKASSHSFLWSEQSMEGAALTTTHPELKTSVTSRTWVGWNKGLLLSIILSSVTLRLKGNTEKVQLCDSCGMQELHHFQLGVATEKYTSDAVITDTSNYPTLVFRITTAGFSRTAFLFWHKVGRFRNGQTEVSRAA